ncbi:DUF3099 domain-containing protein [Actinomadura harenae]|uniref:DUF3099 domain-containing protein n=1 Tax=Actinomadura harenae TaxID=2483351 RepID=A0A3M2LHL2_9ACTN|nr:DUF3099 domain-containing protein [Actinomadura harenae]RMI36921.1 DUF3099 domain-containing protein [Actinomadura harenae]
MKAKHQRGPQVVYTVTNAPRPLSEDISRRQKRYLVSMGIRTGCFLGAVFSGVAGAPLWVVGLFVVGAVFLPYISVVVANGGREPVSRARFETPERPDQNEVSGHRPEIGS